MSTTQYNHRKDTVALGLQTMEYGIKNTEWNHMKVYKDELLPLQLCFIMLNDFYL